MSDLVAYFVLMCLGLVALGLAVFVVTVAYAAARFVCQWAARRRSGWRYVR